jgi:hypothetical protein
MVNAKTTYYSNFHCAKDREKWKQVLESLSNKQSMGARNQVGIGLPYRPARLHSLAELVLEIDSWAP